MSPKKVLVVLTSHDKLANTGKETGFYMSEVSHPVAVLEQAGLTVEYVSPKGGKAPAIGIDLNDPITKAFVEDPAKIDRIDQTFSPDRINPADYSAIFFAGGHGTMWDFAENIALAKIAATIYEQGGIVSAVCHGSAALINIKLADGSYLIAGKTVAGFTNEEEVAVGLSEVVPFLLESALVERGAIHTKAEKFQPHVVVSDRLVTGQNPASAGGCGEAIANLLQQMAV